MTAAAPPFDCASCGRRIGKIATHYLLEDDRVVCGRCLNRPVHAALFPGCPERWHDTLDHLASCGTRAGVAANLGLWPAHDRPEQPGGATAMAADLLRTGLASGVC